jgi:hypothetical protein
LPRNFCPGKTKDSQSRWLPHHARKNGAQVRLYSRPGNDLTRRCPLIVETLARLRSRSCIIDGEAVACNDNGVASFDLVRHHRANESIFLYAFDLIELNGYDLRRDPFVVRKATLGSMLAKAASDTGGGGGLGLREMALTGKNNKPLRQSDLFFGGRNCHNDVGA